MGQDAKRINPPRKRERDTNLYTPPSKMPMARYMSTYRHRGRADDPSA